MRRSAGRTPLILGVKTIVEDSERQTIPSDRREAADASTDSSAQLPISIKTILVPLDFSRAAMQALDYATDLAKRFSAQVDLVHVQMPDEASAVPGAGHRMRECAESVTFLREKVAGIQHEQPAQFWPENCHIRTGRAYQEICELARELHADLIVLTSHGHSGLKRVFLGSTAERVVRFASCPVLVVRQRKRRGRFPLGLPTTEKTSSIRKILAPVDFSQCSMAGAMYAAFMAKTFDAKLCLFHSVAPPAPVVMGRISANLSSRNNLNLTNARLDMEGFAKLDFFRGVKCATEIRTGSAVDQICGETKQPDIDLVVISTHGRTGFNRMLLGSVAEHVVRYAECPVMVVPSRCSTS
jgi:nucleotide-binding universal stress UspA family protein